MNAPRRLDRGPQIGAPPSLEQVPVDRLSVDSTYQRATDNAASRAIIVGMIKAWNWSLCQPLVVARRDDGSLWILDGQHRHTGALERGDILYLPCVILSSLDYAGEARTFVQLNTRRQKLSQAQIFHGMLAAGDADARLVQQLLDETGWRLRRSSNTSGYRAGDLECAPMLVRSLAAKGENPIRFALTILRAAYPETPVRQAATLLKAAMELFEHVSDTGLTARRLIDAISAIQPSDWITRGIMLQDSHRGMSAITAITKAMLDATEGTDKPLAIPPVNATRPSAESAATPMPRATRVQSSPFGTSGRGW